MTNGFFLRAESFFNFATYVDELPRRTDPMAASPSMRKAMASRSSRCSRTGCGAEQAIYLLDEPEAALSPQRQIEFLCLLQAWEKTGNTQLIIATHSPIIMSYPGAALLSFDGGEICPARYTETDHYRVTRRFLMDHEFALQQLLASDEQEDDRCAGR